MGKLKVLPSSLANIIAAGEVVQRPSSVVKELMENAVDAGADDISVIVTDSGRTLVQVIDNGCGMSAPDSVLCFERHATSKISSAEDLQGILTYGFRGEALPSIASVAEVSLKTRRDGDETGTSVKTSDGGKIRSSVCQCPVGTNFSVRNLFFNTPARRRFLKSDNVELRHIIEEFTRVAITRPDVSFRLTSNGRDIFVLKKAKSLKFRVMDLIGASAAKDLVDVRSDTALLSLDGFVGRPQGAHKSTQNQFFFVNGRYFRSPLLHKAVVQAYENLIPEGLQPTYALFIRIDPSFVDVNVSPTKSEVKFEDESVVYQVVFACVREVLGRNSFGADIDFEAASDMQIPQLGRNFQEYRAVQAPQTASNPDYDPFAPEGGAYSHPSSSHVDHVQNYGFLFEQREAVQNDALSIQGRYIVARAASGLMLVDISRARERIFYERSLDALRRGSIVSQESLFPVQLEVGASTVPLFQENARMLQTLGFSIDIISPDTIQINAVPQGCSCEPGKMETLARDLAAVLSDPQANLPELMMQEMAAKMAALEAGHVTQITSAVQARSLVDSLLQCENPELTSSGKRIIRVMDMDEITKLFQ